MRSIVWMLLETLFRRRRNRAEPVVRLAYRDGRIDQPYIEGAPTQRDAVDAWLRHAGLAGP